MDKNYCLSVVLVCENKEWALNALYGLLVKLTQQDELCARLQIGSGYGEACAGYGLDLEALKVLEDLCQNKNR